MENNAAGEKRMKKMWISILTSRGVNLLAKVFRGDRINEKKDVS